LTSKRAVNQSYFGHRGNFGHRLLLITVE